MPLCSNAHVLVLGSSLVPEFYTGQGVGRHILPRIEKARYRIWICSPWISPRYAQLLVQKAREGVDVRVVTCDLEDNRDALKILRGRAVLKPSRIAVLAYTLSTATAPFLIPIYYAYRIAKMLKLPKKVLALDVLLAILLFNIFVTMSLLTIEIYRTVPDVAFIFLGLSIPVLFLYLLFVYVKTRRHVSEMFAMSGSGNGEVKLRVFPKTHLPHAKIYIIDDEAIVGSVNLTEAGLWHNIEHVTIFTEEDQVKKIEQEFLKLFKT